MEEMHNLPLNRPRGKAVRYRGHMKSGSAWIFDTTPPGPGVGWRPVSSVGFEASPVALVGCVRVCAVGEVAESPVELASDHHAVNPH